SGIAKGIKSGIDNRSSPLVPCQNIALSNHRMSLRCFYEAFSNYTPKFQHHATGIRLKTTPFTPDKLLKALGKI
ncbi:MAG: hypothetical protein QME90_09880, partial [Thermodesulfobacteriota bacterium]|nr:hypothetical protein [Thermodesulfobacteriota bacterium]